MAEFANLPLSPALLARYRLRSQRQLRTGLLGGHLTRRKGQSLDFRDFEHYTPGDDIRHVDWRASARMGEADDWLVRRFIAEEQLHLVISVDTRATMALPDCLPKLQVAYWLAEAIAAVALNQGDRVVLHRLFGSAKGSCIPLRDSSASAGIKQALHSFNAYRGDLNKVNMGPLLSHLPPTAVWLIITDLYFPHGKEATRLANQMARAQDGLRWVILAELDSWPCERAQLGEGPKRIEGPYLGEGDNRFEITRQHLQTVAERIEAHKRQFLQPIRRSSLDCFTWHWWEQPDPQEFFKQMFLNDRLLQRLFMRER